MIEFMRTTDLDLYYIFILAGTAFCAIWNLCQIKKMTLITGNVSKSVIRFVKAKNEKFPIEIITALIEIVILTLLQYVFAGDYNVWFGKIVDMGPNYFGTALIGPFMIAAACFVIRLDLPRAFDLIAPSYAFGLIASKFGCFCAGCCNGIEWEHGLYNHETGLVEVPVQLIEMSLALIIFVFLVIIRKKAKPGTLFPAYLILYSSTRFCSEFLRSEPSVYAGLKLYQLLCLIGIAFGVVFLVIALVFGDKISRLYTMEFGIGKRLQKIADEVSFNYHQAKKKIKKQNKSVVHHKKKKRK